MKGEAVVLNRKGKLRALYELDIEFSFSGKIDNNTKDINGKIQMPYIGEEHTEGDFEIKFCVDDSDANEILRKSSIHSSIRSKMIKFLDELKAGANCNQPSNIQQQTTQQTTQKSTTNAQPKINIAKQILQQPVIQETVKKQTFGEIQTSEEYKMPPNELFECFMDPRRVQAYTQASAQISREKDGKFSLMNGSITGFNVEKPTESKIHQKWRFSDWPDNQYSDLVIEIQKNSDTGRTICSLKQTNIPLKNKNGDDVIPKVQAFMFGNLKRIRVMFDGTLLF